METIVVAKNAVNLFNEDVIEITLASTAGRVVLGTTLPRIVASQNRVTKTMQHFKIKWEETQIFVSHARDGVGRN